MNFHLRKSNLNDMAAIFQIYVSAYDGTYPDPTFTQVDKLEAAIKSTHKLIFVAEDNNQQILGCILFLYQEDSQLAKAGAAVVIPEYRGHNITQMLIRYGIEYIQKHTDGLDVLYSTTRTVHKAAQILTLKMGYKQLGIFPNVHKTKEYETHALVAMHFNNSLERRYIDFEQHPCVAKLFDIVQKVEGIPAMAIAKDWDEKVYAGEVPVLEVIEAKEFINYNYTKLQESDSVDLAFFPFHTPNILITSADQELQVYAYVNEFDKHCVITGCKIDRKVSFTSLFQSVTQILRDRGIRYIEIIIRANRLNIIDKIYKAKFLPCAYVPAFQNENGTRYDYVVFSRSFEILDFNHLELTDENEKYLQNYIEEWEKSFLGGYFKK